MFQGAQSPDSSHVYMVCGNGDFGLLPTLSTLVWLSFRLRFVGTDLRGFSLTRQLNFIYEIEIIRIDLLSFIGCGVILG